MVEFYKNGKPKKLVKEKKPKKSKILNCESCGLHAFARSPYMQPHGVDELSILWLAEAPGGDEDLEDDILCGKAGQLLRRELEKVGLDLHRDGKRLNGVNCWPGEKNLTPSNHQVACCRKVIVNPAIRKQNPKFIVLMGNTALDSLWGEGKAKLSIGKFRGRAFPDKATGAWVFPIFHPSYVLRNEYSDNLRSVFHRDLERIAHRVRTWGPPKFPHPKSQIKIVTDSYEVVELLERILKSAERIVFDFETSGLKPFVPGHKIHTISVVPYFEGEERMCYSFPLQYPGAFDKIDQRDILHILRAILVERRIKKVAHNLKFEDLWARVILNCSVNGWEWCTMNNQHLLDNTQGVTGLKWIAWERWGVVGYDSEFSKYSSSVITKDDRKAGIKHTSTHDFNRVHEMPLDALLLYGGYDGILESWLYDEQVEEFNKVPKMHEIRQLFHAGAITFADQQEEGIPVNPQYYVTEGKKIQKEIDAIKADLMTSEEARKFEKAEGKEISLRSNKDLGKLLYGHLGHTAFKTTLKGANSVDAESLEHLNLPFTNNLIRMRKKTRIVSTYFEQILREEFGGNVHPFTSLNRVVTGRPSMDSPNFENLPNREKEAKMAVRRGIGVPPGYAMMANDYGAIEVHGLEWYSRDTRLLNYLDDPNSDLHRDQTQRIFRIPPEMWHVLDGDCTKLLRDYIKNKLVFPYFYGSWHDPCAHDLWRFCSGLPIGDKEGTLVKDYMDMDFRAFFDWVKECEGMFWGDFFAVREWQEGLSEEFQEFGYIESYLGFRYRGFPSRNQLFNYKIQGTAFHVLMWAMITLHRMGIKRGWKSRIMWQIYDQLIWSLWPSEQEEVIEACDDVMIHQVKVRFPWINTPLKVEHEITDVDGTLADLTKIGKHVDSYNDAYDDSAE